MTTSKGHCTGRGNDDYPSAGVESMANNWAGFRLLLMHQRSAKRKVVAPIFPQGFISGGDDQDVNGYGFTVRIAWTRPQITAAGISIGVVRVVGGVGVGVGVGVGIGIGIGVSSFALGRSLQPSRLWLTWPDGPRSSLPRHFLHRSCCRRRRCCYCRAKGAGAGGEGTVTYALRTPSKSESRTAEHPQNGGGGLNGYGRHRGGGH